LNEIKTLILPEVFQPRHSENEPKKEEARIQLEESAYQIETSNQTLQKSRSARSHRVTISITVKILKKLPIIGTQYLTPIFNAVLLKGYFQAQWKVAQVILSLEPGNSLNELTSYGPINLLLIVTKFWGNSFLKGSRK
jgi:hypothetical protein